MVRRSTDSIDHIDSAAEGGTATGTASLQRLARVEQPANIDLNYPDPTALAAIIRDVSRWSGQAFVMEPNLNVKVQIFAPGKLTYNDAWDLFLASLSVVNLRAVQIGKVVKIVTSQTVIAV
jgi:hypothetical protein